MLHLKSGFGRLNSPRVRRITPGNTRAIAYIPFIFLFATPVLFAQPELYFNPRFLQTIRPQWPICPALKKASSCRQVPTVRISISMRDM